MPSFAASARSIEVAAAGLASSASHHAGLPEASKHFFCGSWASLTVAMWGAGEDFGSCRGRRQTSGYMWPRWLRPFGLELNTAILLAAEYEQPVGTMLLGPSSTNLRPVTSFPTCWAASFTAVKHSFSPALRWPSGHPVMSPGLSAMRVSRAQTHSPVSHVWNFLAGCGDGDGLRLEMSSYAATVQQSTLR